MSFANNHSESIDKVAIKFRFGQTFLTEVFSNQHYIWILIQNDGDKNLENVFRSLW